MKPLKDYIPQRGPSLPLRIFEEDKPRFDELKRRLVLASGGYQFSQAQVMKIMLDLADEAEIVKQFSATSS